MERKYQIFISSTYLDLKVEREEIINCILNLGHIPVGMELFNAADESQWSLIKKRIDTSDYYVVIVSDRYGSVDNQGMSYTEKEYRYANKAGIPVLGFIRNQTSIEELPMKYREGENKSKLVDFREELLKRYVQHWSNSADLSRNFVISLTKLIDDKPSGGWIKSIDIKEGLPDPSNFFYTLDDRTENNFTHLIKEAKKVHILARTAVNLLSQYEREIVKIIDNGCEVRFMFVGAKSDAVKYIYGSNTQHYYENAKKMDFHLNNIKSRTGKDIDVKIIKHAPTVSIVYIQKQDGEEYIVVQLYFLHSRVGRNRPLFKMNRNDRWFSAFKDEFDILWEDADDWIQ